MAAATPAFDPRKIALDIHRAIMNGLSESAPIVKNKALANVNRMLKRTGRLGSSVYARVRKIRGGGKLTVGTPVLYGRFWEYGFLRGGKSVRGLVRGAGRSHRRRTASQIGRLIKGGAKYYRRPWLRPAVDEVMPEVVRRVETHLARAMNEYSGTVTIDMKIT